MSEQTEQHSQGPGAGPGGDPRSPSLCLFVRDLAGENHDRWLAQADRSYSPFNRPWRELDEDQRASVSRTIAYTLRNVANAMNESGLVAVRVIVDDPWQDWKPAAATQTAAEKAIDEAIALAEAIRTIGVGDFVAFDKNGGTVAGTVSEVHPDQGKAFVTINQGEPTERGVWVDFDQITGAQSNPPTN